MGGHANIVKFLLQRGANAYISEKDGYTPVHGAAFQGRREIMQLLMDHGVDPSDVRRHADGFDPAHRICWAKGTPSPNQDFPGTLEVLIKAGYEAVNLLRTAPCVVRERTDAIRQLVQEYTDEETFEKAFDHFQYPGAYQEELGEKKAKKAKKAKKGKKTTRAGAGADGGVKKRRGQKRKTGDASAKRNVPTLLKPRYENFEDLLRSTDDDARRRYEGAASFTNTPLPGRSLCELTGLEARYTHPTTKMRFHGRREFRQIEDMPTLAVQAKMTRML